MAKIQLTDYSIVGKNSALAIEKGLADATWYASPVPKDKMRKLLERRDWPAIRDTVLWFALIAGAGIWGWFAWGSWWAVVPFAIYGALYASTSDSRWHESSHGTAFKTDWLNNVLYEIASFMVLRESTPWRWSHTRHHSDTSIVGRDPEFAVPRPPNPRNIIFSFFNLNNFPNYFRNIVLHSMGKLLPAEKEYIPTQEYGRVFFTARIYVLIYASVISLSIYMRSFLPLMYVGLPNFYGAWLMPIYFYTQHAGLAEDVLDHRLNCRTVYMNPVNRYLYWNMNYHVEHHMFPLVPYHALPQLHALIKDDSPPPYRGMLEAYREVIPAVLRQMKDPTFYIKRKLPTPTNKVTAPSTAQAITAKGKAVDGWIEVCASDLLLKEDVIRFDHEKRTYAIYRTADNQYYATDGLCTHGNTHLADGMVKGKLIECPKHNGRFDIRDGSPQRNPVCVALKTYKVRVNEGNIFVNLSLNAQGEAILADKTYSFKVVSNHNVATYIKELVLEPEESSEKLRYQPGDYLQINIPAYKEIPFRQIDVREPFARVWKAQHVDGHTASNEMPTRRNYSLATNPERDKQFRFNVRIATPPHGQDCKPGVGSSYVFNLKAGDKVTARGPFGTFHIKNTDKEMVYLGGGAGMAPLRAHISHLLETQKTSRKISFWYGARSLQEIFYRDYFEGLAAQFSNFSFHLALSEPQPEDNWASHTGFIHTVLMEQYLRSHGALSEVEFYLCGPPAMIKAGTDMLKELRVAPSQIAYDEFS